MKISRYLLGVVLGMALMVLVMPVFSEQAARLEEPLRIDMMAVNGKYLYVTDNVTVHIYGLNGGNSQADHARLDKPGRSFFLQGGNHKIPGQARHQEDKIPFLPYQSDRG